MSKWIFLVVLAATSVANSPSSATATSFQLIGSNSNGSDHFLFDLTVESGLATNQRSIGFDHSLSRIAGIALDPFSGNLFGLTTAPWSRLLRINSKNGAVDIDLPTELPSVYEGDLAFHPITGELYGVQNSSSPIGGRQLFKIDVQTGSSEIIGAIAAEGDYSALGFDGTGLLYAINTAGNDNSILEIINIDDASVVLSTALNMDLGSTAAMTFHPTSNTSFVVDGGTGGTNSLYNLDVRTGVLSLLGSTGIDSGFSGLTFIRVPEPSSILTVMLASTLLLIASRRITYEPKELIR